MLSQTEERYLRTAHQAIAAPAGLRFVAHEGCRERVGKHDM